MRYKRLKIYEDKLNDYKKKFNEIINCNNNEKLEELKKIIDNCNIFEQFNLEYLKVLKNFENKENFEKDLKKYEVTISDENLKKYFKEFYNNNTNSITNITSIHTSKKIQLIIAQLITLQFSLSLNKEGQKDNITPKIDEPKNQETLEQILMELKTQSKNPFKTHFQLLPFDNIKLFLNEVYHIFCENIYEQIKSFSKFNNYKTNEEKQIDDDLSNEIELMTQGLKLNSNFNSSNRITEEEIELKEIKLIAYRILHNNKFKEYIKGIKNFYFETSDYFNIRIKNDDFKDETYIYIYEKYFFFISNYNFFY